MPPLRCLASLCGCLLALSLLVAQDKGEKDKLAVLDQPDDKASEPEVVYVPSPPEIVAKMLEVAKVGEKDVVFDLGCGDGRIVVAAAKKGARAVGFDIDPLRIKDTKANIEKNKVDKLAFVRQRNLFKVDLSQATVVTLFLLEDMNKKLIPQLEKMKDGSRIVSHAFIIKGLIADKGYPVKVKSKDGLEHEIFLYTTPLKRDKKAEDD